MSEPNLTRASAKAMPFEPWPTFDAEQIRAVQRVLESGRVNYWTGRLCRQFEQDFAGYVGTAHGVALFNGTVALDSILLALQQIPVIPGSPPFRKGDEIIVTPRTFLASASSIVNAGLRPVFADVDPDSQNITAQSIEAVLTPRTRGILAVHLAGWPCDLPAMKDLASSHDLVLLEDCAQAHGARIDGRSVGSFGMASAWSFCQDKIMSTGGEGGMVTTDHADLWSQLWSYKDHGKDWDAVYNEQHPPGFRWVHHQFGSNYRMLEMQAAIGLVQLDLLPEWVRQRQRNAETIWQCARSLPGLRVPIVPDSIEHGCYRCYVFVEPHALRSEWSRDRILGEMVADGVPAMAGSCPEVYLEKAFDHTGFAPAQRLPVARQLGETGMTFLVHPTLSAASVQKTCEVLTRVMRQAVQ